MVGAGATGNDGLVPRLRATRSTTGAVTHAEVEAFARKAAEGKTGPGGGEGAARGGDAALSGRDAGLAPVGGVDAWRRTGAAG